MSPNDDGDSSLATSLGPQLLRNGYPGVCKVGAPGDSYTVRRLACWNVAIVLDVHLDHMNAIGSSSVGDRKEDHLARLSAGVPQGQCGDLVREDRGADSDGSSRSSG